MKLIKKSAIGGVFVLLFLFMYANPILFTDIAKLDASAQGWCTRCRGFKFPIPDGSKILCPDCNQKVRMRPRRQDSKNELVRY